MRPRALLHRPHRHRVPVRHCGPGVYSRRAVDRDGNGVLFCPDCAATGVEVEPLMGGKVRVLEHDLLSSVTVRAVNR